MTRTVLRANISATNEFQPRLVEESMADTEQSAGKTSSGGAAVPKKAARARRAKRTGTKKRGRRRKVSARRSKASPAKRRGRPARRPRFSDEQRQQVLQTARREGLTGAQVSQRFGISTLTYYNWRKKAGTASRRQGRPRGRKRLSKGWDFEAMLQDQLRERIRKMLPEIIAAEIAEYLR